MWIKAQPVVTTGIITDPNHIVYGTKEAAYVLMPRFSTLRKCAIATPIIQMAVFFIGYFFILHLAPHLAHNWLISETISAVANDGEAYPAFIITNTLLSMCLMFIGVVRSRQIEDQILMILDGATGSHPIHHHMRRLNVATLMMGGLAVISGEMLAIIRIKVDFVVHITFAQICFWRYSVMLIALLMIEGIS